MNTLFKHERTRRQALATGHVIPSGERCVQCGICSYSCPVGIYVRRYAWSGKPVTDSRCLTCGECVSRCPRGGLQFVPTHLFRAGKPGTRGG